MDLEKLQVYVYYWAGLASTLSLSADYRYRHSTNLEEVVNARHGDVVFEVDATTGSASTGTSGFCVISITFTEPAM